MNIGIIGNGLMGSAIGHRLLERGFQIYLYNRTKERSNVLVKKGAIRMEQPSIIGKECNLQKELTSLNLWISNSLFQQVKNHFIL